MSAATFHQTHEQQLACDVCGALIDPSERGRTCHQTWHAEPAPIIDLTVTEAEARVDAA